MKHPLRRTASCGLLAGLVALIVLSSLQMQYHHLKDDLGRGGFATENHGPWRRKAGAEGLPRGIVESQSDMYLRPLWDSAPKTKDPPFKLQVPWLQFLNENYTVMLFHYHGNVDGWRNLQWSDKAIHILAHNQTNWWFAKRFLHPNVVAIYNFIFLWDEDLVVENFDPRRYLDVMVSEGLEITQPALDPDLSTDIHHRITIRNKMTKVHRRIYDNHASMNCSDESKGPPCTG